MAQERGEGRHLRGIPRPHPAAHRGRRLQHHPAHGRPGAPLLRLVRLPRLQLLRRLARASARPRSSRRLVDAAHGAGLARHHGPGPLPRRQQRGRGPVAASTARSTSTSTTAPRGDHAAWDSRCFDYGKIRGPALPALQLPLLAGRVPLRRLPLRRRHQHALPATTAWARPSLSYDRLFRRQRGRGRADLPRAGQPADPRRCGPTP